MRLIRQSGHALLVLLGLIFLMGFMAAALQDNTLLGRKIELQQQASETEALEQIRSGLMGFAANQGVHSQSHLGHLPCPANTRGEAPATICLDKPWGYLPIGSKSAINYLNQGLDPRIHENRVAALKDWEYAVSAQLVQPNLLNWGRWVDFSQPAIQLTVPHENNKVHPNIAAVVARAIKPTGQHRYAIEPPYILITVPELQQAMSRMQVRLIHETLASWYRENPQANQQLANHENLQPMPIMAGKFQPVDSGCSCRCTQTRCNCSCTGAGQWRSGAACWGSNSNCQAFAGYSRCTSDEGQPCIFSGPARMENAWPVSRFEPVAAANKSCRPTRVHECPLSKTTAHCTCDFSWPDSTKNGLTGKVIELGQNQ